MAHHHRHTHNFKYKERKQSKIGFKKQNKKYRSYSSNRVGVCCNNSGAAWRLKPASDKRWPTPGETPKYDTADKQRTDDAQLSGQGPKRESRGSRRQSVNCTLGSRRQCNYKLYARIAAAKCNYKLYARIAAAKCNYKLYARIAAEVSLQIVR